MRVVEKCAMLMERELVNVPSAWHHWILAETRNPVHLHGHFEPVPVHGCHLRKMVLEDHPDTFSFVDFYRGAGHTAVVAPGVYHAAWDKLSSHWLCYQVKFFNAVHHLPGQLRNIGSLHSQVITFRSL